MPKRIKLANLPKTPHGRNIQPDASISADEVEMDDEVTVKTSMFRQCVPGNAWFEGDGDDDDDDDETDSLPKVAAIVSSPMVDARPRRLSYAKSFTEGSLTPMRKSFTGLSQAVMRRLSHIASPNENRRKTLHGLLSTSKGKFDEAVEQSSMDSPLREIIEDKENATPHPVSSALQSPVPTETTFHSPLRNAPVEPNAINSFHSLASLESARLRLICDDWNIVLEEQCNTIPRPALDSIRTAVGKCQLVLQHKIPFFQRLVDMAEQSTERSNGDDTVQPATDANDLAGYWALVTNEIERADASFMRLRRWRDVHNWDVAHCPITPPRSAIPVKAQRRVGIKPIGGGAIPKRVANRIGAGVTHGSSQTKKPLGRRLEESHLPEEAANALAKAVGSSAKKKPAARSGLAEFLKAKKAAMSAENVNPSSPLTIFASNLPNTRRKSLSRTATPSTSRKSKVAQSQPTDALITSTASVSLHALPYTPLTVAKLANTSSQEISCTTGDSFAIPKQQRAPQSSIQRAKRSTSKLIPTVLPTSAARTPLISAANTPLTDRRYGTRVASTPIVAQSFPSSPHLLSVKQTRTPTRSKRADVLAAGCATRPGTPRPPLPLSSKRNASSMLDTNYVERALLYSLSSSTSSVERPSNDVATANTSTSSRVTRSKRISFATELSHTPGGHRFGSGSPRQAYPITPANKSGSLVASARLHRRNRTMLDTLSPLGLHPVAERQSARSMLL